MEVYKLLFIFVTLLLNDNVRRNVPTSNHSSSTPSPHYGRFPTYIKYY